MLSFGNISIKDMYYGSIKIGEAYLGSTKVYSSGGSVSYDSYIIEIVPNPTPGNLNIELLDVNGSRISSSNTYKLELNYGGYWNDSPSTLNSLWSGQTISQSNINAMRIYFWSSSLQSGDNIRMKIIQWSQSTDIITNAIEYDSVNQIVGSTIKQQSATLMPGSNTTILTMP